MIRNGLGYDLFDDIFSAPMFGNDHVMKTDITEKDGKYEMKMDLPGYKKEEIRLSLKDGNLTVSAEHNSSDETKDEQGNVIRRERYSGSCTRSFYVGESVKESDVHAAFENGTLTLTIPVLEQLEDNRTKYIAIE